MVTVVTKVVMIVRKSLGNCIFLPSLIKFEYFKRVYFPPHAHPPTSIKLYENPSNGSRVVSCGWTDRQT
jgi:hypothetical protein